MANTTITTPAGDKIAFIGEETVPQLLSTNHLINTLRKMGCGELAAWAKQVQEEDARAEALNLLDQEAA